MAATSQRTVHHIGWVVRSIDASRAHFEDELGLAFRSDEAFPGLRVAFFGAGSAMVELLEPEDGGSDLGLFLRERGEGVHHLALRVDDVRQALTDCPGRGLRPIDASPRAGARGTLVGFADAQREGGILIQFVQER
ncbi:MAG: VOC family protein [Candidatus Dormibacteraeota bacterium]|nr:VOC family protein [Candidatus Dormibacteraeota bacterium]